MSEGASGDRPGEGSDAKVPPVDDSAFPPRFASIAGDPVVRAIKEELGRHLTEFTEGEKVDPWQGAQAFLEMAQGALAAMEDELLTKRERKESHDEFVRLMGDDGGFPPSVPVAFGSVRFGIFRGLSFVWLMREAEATAGER